MTPLPVPAQRLVALDLLRFVAAMLVVAFHFFAGFAINRSPTVAHLAGDLSFAQAPVALTWWGWVGVEIFFMLSGAVIAESATNRRAGDFLRGRVLRLVPAAWLCASITLVASGVVFGQWPWAAWARTVAFVPQRLPVDPVYWTLAIECVFYAVLAIAIATTRVRVATIGVVTGTWSLGFWIAAGVGGLATPDLFGWHLCLAWHGIYFALGIALWECWSRPPDALRCAWLATLGLAAWAEVGVGTAINGRLPAPAMTLVPHMAVTAAVALIAVAPRLQGVLTRSRQLVAAASALGAMTYPLYLVHQLVGLALIVALARTGMPVEIARAVALGLVVGLAWAIARYAEPALRRALAAVLNPRHAPARDRRATASLPVG